MIKLGNIMNELEIPSGKWVNMKMSDIDVSGMKIIWSIYKIAYTSQGLFIDPKTTEYKKYKNIDELKNERGNINYNMTSEQQSEYDKRKYRELETENNRQNTIRQRDVIISNNYSKTHINMLGYQGTALS